MSYYAQPGLLGRRRGAAAPSGIQFVGSKSYSGLGNANIAVTTTGLTGGIDTQARSSDLVVMALATADTGANFPHFTLASDPGFISRVDQQIQDTRTTVHQVWTLAAASDAPSVTLTNPGSVGGVVVIIYVFRNAVYGSRAVAVQADQNDANPPAVTPTVAGSWIFCHAATSHNQGSRNYSSIPGLATILQAEGNISGNFDVNAAAGLKTDWTSGSFDPSVWTWSGSFSSFFSWCATTMILTPTS